jgi:hypothetical protein
VEKRAIEPPTTRKKEDLGNKKTGEEMIKEKRLNAPNGKPRNFQGNHQGGKPKPRPKQIRSITEGGSQNKADEKAERTRLAIRQILDKNYPDRESEDFLELVTQTENMGF